MENDIDKEMCDDCKRLVGAGRRTEPLKYLVLKKGKAVSSIMGAADEDYYVCRVCRHEWLHEIGSCIMAMGNLKRTINIEDRIY